MPANDQRKRRRRLLDLEAIIDAGIALLEETGTLTMAALGERLGAHPSSIYHHVRGRTEILTLIRDRLLGSAADAMDPQAPWDEQVAAWVRSLQSHLARHPRLLPALIASEVGTGSELAGYDRLAALLESAGFPAEELILWISVLDQYAIGSVLDLASPDEVWPVAPDSSSALHRAVMAAPRGRARVEAAFGLGVEALIAGMRARLAALTASGREVPAPRSSS